MKDLLIGLILGFLLGSYLAGSTVMAELNSFDILSISGALSDIASAIDRID